MPTGEFLPLRCQDDGRFHSLTHSLRFSRYRVVCSFLVFAPFSQPVDDLLA